MDKQLNKNGNRKAQKTPLEARTLIFNYLSDISLELTREDGNIAKVFSIISENCTFESDSETTIHKGYAAVTKKLTQIAQEIYDKAEFEPEFHVVEIENESDEAPKLPALGLLMEDHPFLPEDGALLFIEVNKDNKISSFTLREYHEESISYLYEFSKLFAARDQEEDYDSQIVVNEDIYTYISFFLKLCDFSFDEDPDVPIDKWLECLERWKRFYSFESFDDAFEDAFGIDYSDFSAKRRGFIPIFGRVCASLWQNRAQNVVFLEELCIWTEKHKAFCDFIEIIYFY